MLQPTGWRILILPYAGKGVTDGGIQLVQLLSITKTSCWLCGKNGSDCYKDKSNLRPLCEEKQWVLIGRYAGARFKLAISECRIINDDEVIATNRF